MVTNLSPEPIKRVMKIRIGKGGGVTSASEDKNDNNVSFEPSTIGNDGNGGITSISVISGNKTVNYTTRKAVSKEMTEAMKQVSMGKK